MDGSFPSLDLHFQSEKLLVGWWWVACRIIVSAPVPAPFLWTLDLGLGFGTWIWDLDFGFGSGTGLGLDNLIFLCRTWRHIGTHFDSLTFRL